MSVTTLRRAFRFGATTLDDPAPELSPERALRLYVGNYPFLASATLGEPIVEGDVMIFPVQKPVATTKG